MAGRFLTLMLAVVLIAVAVTGCVGWGFPPLDSTPVSNGKPVIDYNSLIDNLRRERATVEPFNSVKQAFFSVEGQVIKVNGEDVQVFEYNSESAAEAEAKLVSPDGGTIGTSSVFWVAPPHFYWSGKIIALYVGQNSEITRVLEKILGPQFAGR